MASPDTAVEAALVEISTAPSKRQIRDMLERLSLSADAKAILADLADISVRVGKRVVAIGRKILDLALALLRTFPHVIFGAMLSRCVRRCPRLYKEMAQSMEARHSSSERQLRARRRH